MPPKKKSSTTKQSQPPPPKQNEQQTPISWPLIPANLLAQNQYLTLETLLENQIYIIRNFFPSSLCTTFVKFLASLPLVTTPGKPKRGEAVRVNDRFQICDYEFARKLWDVSGLGGLLEKVNDDEQDDGIVKGKTKEEIWGGEVVGLNPNIRVYRYTKGQYFDQHYDESNNLNLQLTAGQPPTRCHTTYTLLLYLTSSPDVLGGETVFYQETHHVSKMKKAPEPISVMPERGMALLHKHGKDCLLHEGKVVIEGEKWVLRTDLVVRG